ncbi:hypothetical protein ACEPAF_2320 [Sanghuangporus sanghuang]
MFRTQLLHVQDPPWIARESPEEDRKVLILRLVMIIKDDKVVEPVRISFLLNAVEQAGDNPPPYSPALPARVQAVDQNVTSPPGSQLSFSIGQNRNHTVVFRPRGASSVSSLAPPIGIQGPGSSGSSTYSSIGSISGAATSSTATIRPSDPYPSIFPPSDILRTSYLQTKRTNKPISTRVVVNPYLPVSLNPQIDVGTEDSEDNWSAGEDDAYGPRLVSSLPGVGDKNVCLMSKNANINAEIWVVGRSPENTGDDGSMYGRKKAGIDIRSKNGFIHVKMHANQISPSFALRIANKNGGVRVILPRTFSGPLTTRTQNGWVSFSPELASFTTTFTEIRGLRKSFVGDFLDSGYGRGEWPGCSLDITCENGRIKLCYLDEDTEKSMSLLFYVRHWYRTSLQSNTSGRKESGYDSDAMQPYKYWTTKRTIE